MTEIEKEPKTLCRDHGSRWQASLRTPTSIRGQREPLRSRNCKLLPPKLSKNEETKVKKYFYRNFCIKAAATKAAATKDIDTNINLGF